MIMYVKNIARHVYVFDVHPRRNILRKLYRLFSYNFSKNIIYFSGYNLNILNKSGEYGFILDMNIRFKIM